jgi:restriction system protein
MESLFEHGYVALGWPNLGDLGQLPPNREAFRHAVADAYGPSASTQTIATVTGILYRFVHVMRIGDIVVSPAPLTHQVRIGRVNGQYRHDPSIYTDYPALRPIEWLASVPRSELSNEARASLRGRMSCYRAQTGADDFRRVAREAS